MNEIRLNAVQAAFNKIDKDQSGCLDLVDIRDLYKAERHPDVISGKKTPDQVLIEFLETFEVHHNLSNNSSADGTVTLEEFIDYYANISASIDDDDYFLLMINNSWNLSGDANPYQKYEKGWGSEEAAGKKIKYQ